jgi:hypothetical protein
VTVTWLSVLDSGEAGVAAPAATAGLTDPRPMQKISNASPGVAGFDAVTSDDALLPALCTKLAPEAALCRWMPHVHGRSDSQVSG